MIFTKYTYPLPNNGSGYSFSEQELVNLLDSVYNKGFEDGVASTIIPETTCASTTNEIVIKTSKESSPVKDYPSYLDRPKKKWGGFVHYE